MVKNDRQVRITQEVTTVRFLYEEIIPEKLTNAKWW